jgi:hypothetical protein
MGVFGAPPPAPTYGAPVPGMHEAEEAGAVAPVGGPAAEPFPTTYPAPFAGQYPFGMPPPAVMAAEGEMPRAAPMAPVAGMAPAAPGGPYYMPSKRGRGTRLGGITPEEEEGEPIESTLGQADVPGFDQLAQHLTKGTPDALLKAQKLHSSLLSGDDTRVKKQADNMFKGEHFVQGDPLHTNLLQNTPKNERVALAAGQTAIANKQPMHITYASAPPSAAKESPITRASREVNYDESSPQARMLGQTNARLSGHSFIPTSIGISLGKKAGAPNNGYIQGISTNVAAHNHYHLNKALAEAGEQTPYPNLDTRFHNDLSGYIQNLQAGHRGTGADYAPGTKEYPAQPDLDYVPYRLSQRKADFLNAIINNQAARHQPALKELARKGGTLLTEEGEVNPIRHAIDVRQAGLHHGPPEEIADKGIQKAANDRWSKNILEPTIRSFNAGLIHALHERPEQIAEAIRPKVPGFQELTKTLGKELGGEKGRPDVPLSVAFMPRALSPQEHEELTGNIRKQWLSGKIRTPEYVERMKEVPGPGEDLGPYFMPAKGYVSPNVREATKIPAALEQISSKEHRAARNFYQRVEDMGQIGQVGRVSPTLGNWEGTSEGSSMIHDEDGTFDDMRLKNAIRGLYSAQKGTATFEYKDGAPDRLYDIDFPDANHQEVDNLIAKHGFPGSTIYEGPEGHLRADLLDYGGENHANAIKLAKEAGSQSPEYHHGQLAFDGADTRESAARAYRQLIGASGIQTRGAPGSFGLPRYAAQGKHPLQDAYEEAEDNYARLIGKAPREEEPTAEPMYMPRGRVPAEFKQAATENMAPLGYKAAIKLKDGEVVTGDWHDQAYMRAGSPRDSEVESYGFAKRKGEGFLSMGDADKMLADRYALPTSPISPIPRQTGTGEPEEEPPAEPMFMAAKPKAAQDIPFKDLSAKAQKAYVSGRVKDRLANQIEGAVPLRPLRKEDGSYQNDEAGNPKWEKDHYNLVNSPILGDKALSNAPSNLKKTGTDIYDPSEHKHLNDIDRKRLSWLEQKSAVDTMSDKIVDAYKNQMQHVPEVMAAKGWYSRMQKKLKAAFGDDAELFAQLLGATSARTGVHQNFIQSLDAYDQLKKGNFDRHIEKYLEAHDHLNAGTLRQHLMDLGIHSGVDEEGNPLTDAEAMSHWILHHDILPKQKNGQKYNANSNQVLKVLAQKWLTSVKAPKTPNFAGNLSGRTREATIDVWAARFLHELGNEGNTKPWMLQPGGEGGVRGLDFAFAQRAFRKAADKLGIEPDDAQAISWFHQKHLWDQRGHTRGKGAKKASFDETFDKIFKPSGERLTDEEARQAFAGEKEETPEEYEEAA